MGMFCHSGAATAVSLSERIQLSTTNLPSHLHGTGRKLLSHHGNIAVTCLIIPRCSCGFTPGLQGTHTSLHVCFQIVICMSFIPAAVKHDSFTVPRKKYSPGDQHDYVSDAFTQGACSRYMLPWRSCCPTLSKCSCLRTVRTNGSSGAQSLLLYGGRGALTEGACSRNMST